MDSFSDGVMIALLPTTTDWCKIECPHMTLVYAGKIDDLKPSAFNEMAKDAASIAMISGPIFLQVTGTEIFGDDNEKVNVLTLRPTEEVMAMRRFVKFWNASEHDFRPHATIGPTNLFVDTVPDVLRFDRIMVGWGKESLVFRLKNA